MSLLYFLFMILFVFAISSMLFPAEEPRYLPRRRRRRLKGGEYEEDEDEQPRSRSRKRRGGKGRKRARKEERSVENIWVGDVIHVEHLDRDFVVEKHYTCEENGWEWDEYTLDDGGDEFNLSVADEGKEIYLSHAIEDLEIGHPPPEELEYDGQEFELVSSGKADSIREDSDKSHAFRYHSYEGPDGKVLTVEDWEGELEYYLGEPLHKRDLSILPGKSED